MLGSYPPGVTGAEDYFYIADEPLPTCFDCDGVIFHEGDACPQQSNVCRKCHGCDESCEVSQ